jgi:solute carrier family 25 (mitochondrial aspartate/glutamate transporter), member 12/13
MNQRHSSRNTILYQGPLDCLRQIMRNEGTTGLYRGIVPNLLLVAPERAIKLQVHHLVKEAVCSVSDSDPAQTSLWIEAFSGGCAGASQILVTNPMEIAKIRLQMQGETRRVLLSKGITPLSSPGFAGVLRGLGFPGVYRGASACLMRDIPFSAIYFTSYAALKHYYLPSNGSEHYNGLETLLAGTAAAIPAALLTNPADVVKTRLQTIARPGETTYHGIDDCFRKILDEEGPIAFTRGGLTRVLRIAPQFGISMLAFETVTKFLNLSSYDTARPPTDIPVASTRR